MFCEDSKIGHANEKDIVSRQAYILQVVSGCMRGRLADRTDSINAFGHDCGSCSVQPQRRGCVMRLAVLQAEVVGGW